MRTVREIYQTAGRRLVGVCPTARAARELADGAGIESFTIPRFNMHAHLDANTIVVVDEAAMCATVDLHQIVTRAHAAGAKVILVGDHHQLPEIAAGGGFRAALDALGHRACELTINRRQHHQWEHAALDHLRNGDVAAFWNTYTEHDRVVLADTATDIRNRAVADWWDSHTAGGSAYLLAGTRAEAKLLNTLARQHATEAGHLTGATFDLRGRGFQVGDRIVLLRNMGGQLDLDTGARCRVDNGMIATITHINHHSSDINIELANGRHLQLTGDYVQAGCIDHGYATTIHKAQGLTCDDIYVVGPAGLYRESGYVALSRARNTAHLYATTRDAANIAEPTHTTGIPLPTENVDDPEHDLINALTHSHAKQFALTTCPDLDVIADTANNFDLGQLTERQRHINTAIHSLRTQGLADPHTALERLRLAADHRQFMHVGGRVNALDWDNVGTIKHLHDSTGHATVAFTTSDGQHTNTKTLPWEQLKPIDHPEPSELTDLAERFFTELSERINHDLATWNDALADYGINAGEPQVIPSAIAQRERKLFHQLRATPPDWLTWWAGPRPTDPTAAVVYDDHIRTLATWRDQHQLGDHTPGYGPLPDNPDLADQWRQLMDTALATRHWLTQRGPTTPETPAPISIADARQRLFELDELFAQAPADQRKIVDDLLADPNMDIADKIDALQHAGAHQTARQDWILEHWPNVIEHHELTTIVDNAGPLGHWPPALPARAQQLLDEVTRSQRRHTRRTHPHRTRPRHHRQRSRPSHPTPRTRAQTHSPTDRSIRHPAHQRPRSPDGRPGARRTATRTRASHRGRHRQSRNPSDPARMELPHRPGTCRGDRASNRPPCARCAHDERTCCGRTSGGSHRCQPQCNSERPPGSDPKRGRRKRAKRKSANAARPDKATAGGAQRPGGGARRAVDVDNRTVISSTCSPKSFPEKRVQCPMDGPHSRR